jgi:YesN/AraC family two-component response regulator
MEDYNKIIESLGIRYLKAQNIHVPRGFQVSQYRESDAALLVLKRGKIFHGTQELQEGQALFIPTGRHIDLSFGEESQIREQMDMEEFAYRRPEFFTSEAEQTVAEFTLVVFETKVFDTVNFFQTLDIPPFVLNNPKVNMLLYEIMKEQQEEHPGYQRIIKLRTENLCIEVIRYILESELFVDQIKTNSTYFKDPRLISVLNYIKDNLEGELTNRKLSEVAKVSEDYVGQYFKSLTGINPQDYIEYQRMEHAVELLRTTKMSIRDIGKSCGYKDTAYFCRRFKMMYGVPAGKMRKRETLMNV